MLVWDNEVIILFPKLKSFKLKWDRENLIACKITRFDSNIKYREIIKQVKG